MDSSSKDNLPVAVIGAGPVGLAAAAHLKRRGLPYEVFEAAATVGGAVRSWGHIRTFTPWQWIVDASAAEVLAPTGWAAPSTPIPPNGDEMAEHYLEPLAAALAPHVHTGHRVLAISRDGLDKAKVIGRPESAFLVRTRREDGAVVDVRARAVIDASGTWEQPNPLGSSGLPARGENEAADFLVGPLPDVLGRDRARFASRRTLVVGAGHSAANTLLNLGRLAEQEPGTQIVWAIRRASAEKAYGGGEADQLSARGQLGTDLQAQVASGVLELVTGFAVAELAAGADAGTVTVVGADGRRIEGVHNIAAATGFRPDLDLLRELQLDLHPGLEAPRTLAPLIDPAYHSCGTVPPHGHRDLAHPEPGFYIVGMKSYGRAPTFLITTGNEQVRSVVAAIAGDLAAADAVDLVLPETGVCSVNDRGEDTGAGDGCCGSTPALEELSVPAAAHRARPEGLVAQGFASGVAGGGTIAEVTRAATVPTGGGCCTG